MEHRQRRINPLKYILFITVGAFLVTTISCLKETNNPEPPPTITSFYPPSDSANVAVTIYGTHLTGASSVSFGGTPAVSFRDINDSTIIAIVGTGTTGWINVTTPGGTAGHEGFTLLIPYPLVDGLYDSSNQVASANLIAHWPFDSSNEEVISKTVGTNIGTVTAIGGQIGNAVDFTDGGFVYPAIPNLNNDTALQQYTVTMWVNMPANNASEYPFTNGRESSLFQVNASSYNNVWGLMAVEVHSNAGYGGDTLVLGAEFTQITPAGSYTDDTSAVLNPANTSLIPSELFPGAGQWSFVAETYNGTSQVINIYGDSILYLTKTLNDISTPFQLSSSGNQVTIGTFEFSNDGFVNAPPAAAISDTVRTDKIYWAHGMNGSLDDIRVFNRVLTQHEIGDLYELGLENR
jgi:hypothetical protein